MKKLFLILLTGFLSVNGFSQSMNALYHMYFVPEAHRMNPAIQPQSSFYINLVETSLAFESPFAIEDVLWYNEPTQQSITFLDELGDISVFEDAVNNYNFLGGDAQAHFVPSMGFRIRDSYITLEAAVKNITRASIPGDFINYGLYGNESGDFFDFSSLVIDQTTYAEIALGYSRQIDNQLTAGIKVKGLFGAANLTTDVNRMFVDTDREMWEVLMDADMKINAPAMEIGVDANGDYSLDSIQFNEIETDNVWNLIQNNVINNFGLGVDLGFIYKPIDKLSLSASLVDLGFINWKSNPYTISFDDSFLFEGVLADSAAEGSDFEYLQDSIMEIADPSFSNAAYTTYTPAKLFIGGQYFLTDKINLGFVSRSELYKGSLREEATVSLNWLLWRWMSGTFTYSLSNYTSNHWGLGWSFRLPPLQFYFMFDNLGFRYAEEVNGGYPVPISMDAFALRFGLNFAVGFKSYKRKLKDKPLIY